MSVFGRCALISLNLITLGLLGRAAQAAAALERVVAVQPGDTVLDCAAGDTLRWSGHLSTSGSAASGLTDAFLEADGRVVAQAVPDPADGGFMLDWAVAPGSHVLRLGVTRRGGSRVYPRRLSVNALASPAISWDGFDHVSATDFTVSATPTAEAAFKPVRFGVFFNGATLALLSGDGCRAVLPLSKLPPGMYPLRLEAFDAAGARYGCPEETLTVPPPTTGEADPAFRAFDDTMAGFMARHHIPGGSLAVVKDGRIVYTRGYGWADADKQELVQPTSVFRIASLSKSITALAVMKLVQEGRLDLDAKAFPLTGLTPILSSGSQTDPRLQTVTVRQLLHHTGGWDSKKSLDPMGRNRQIAEELGLPSPVDQTVLIRYMMGKPLDFDPGTRFAYSNLGYCVLGAVIERVTGEDYYTYVKQNVLAPMGIRRMQHARTRLQERLPGEVRYYDALNRTAPSIYTEDSHAPVPFPYGAFDVEHGGAAGAWVSSAVDMARYAACLDASSDPPLKPQFLRMLYEHPSCDPPDGPVWYGMGWNVKTVGGPDKVNRWHDGFIPGSMALLVRRSDGVSWAVLFNGGKEEDILEIDSALHHAADAVPTWPAHDLFARYR